MPLNHEVQDEITVLVHGGFEDASRIVEIIVDEMYEPGELDEDEVQVFVDQCFAAWELAKRQWPRVTDCDRLDQAFDQLEQQGVVCLQNAGYTQSDGYNDIREELRQRSDATRFIGYCFFHEQDLARAVRGGGLYLAFGPLDAALEHSLGLEVGQRVMRALVAAGLHAQWSGTFDQRISVPVFDWKSR